MLDSEGAVNGAKEVYQALAPATAMFPEGKVLILGTPRWASGWFYEMSHREDIRQWHATTREMNPRVSQAFLDGEEAADPVYFAREYLAEFTAGIGAVFPDALVRAAVFDREPAFGGYSVVSLDASSGTGKDTYACLLGNVLEDRLIVRDIRGWKGSSQYPVSHRMVLDEVADIARDHRAVVVIDQWASEPLRQGLAERGCSVRPFAWTNETKEEAVLTTRRMLYEHRLLIPRHQALITELVNLEQTQLPSGRSRYAAPGNQHDDYATALLALAHHAFINPWSFSGPVSTIV